MIKVYQKYILKEYFFILIKITFVFFVLGMIMGILEELNFFTEYDVKYFLPIYLVILNVPSLIYEIFPFIFLISCQFFFIKLIDRGELVTFKNNGLNNIEIIKLILITFIFSLFIIIVFYNLSAILKFEYLDIKKNYTKDNKYLATITENGLWIKDNVGKKINFINAKKFSLNSLEDVDIIQLNENFDFEKNIKAKEADIQNKQWKLNDVKIIDNENKIINEENIVFNSNFNYEEINNLFSNLSSLNVWNLMKLKKDYISINYSTTEIDYHIQRIISYPFFITIIAILSSILMLNISYQKPKLFLIVLGVLISVIIYYISFSLERWVKMKKFH